MTDVLAVGAHPDDLEVAMGGTAAKLAVRGREVHFLDLTAGEPARHAAPGERAEQAARAAEILGVERSQLGFQDRCLRDTTENRLRVAGVIREHRPRWLFTTHGSGVHPDHGAVTDLVVGAVFYARLPKWEEVPGGERLADTDPHEVDRLFFAHCRMEEPWDRFDFAVDVTEHYERKMEAVSAYESVFGGDLEEMVRKHGAEDRYTGSLVDVRFAEPFRARRELLVEDPSVFESVRYG